MTYKRAYRHSALVYEEMLVNLNTHHYMDIYSSTSKYNLQKIVMQIYKKKKKIAIQT